VSEILNKVLHQQQEIIHLHYTCSTFHPSQRPEQSNHISLLDAGVTDRISIQNWVASLNEQEGRRLCDYPGCSNQQLISYYFTRAPYILCFYLRATSPDTVDNTYIDVIVQLTVSGTLHLYHLAGIIYYGSGHFTSRIITENRDCLFYDGMTDNGQFKHTGNLNTHNIDLNKCRGKNATCVLYMPV
jgi:hypothetical protein